MPHVLSRPPDPTGPAAAPATHAVERAIARGPRHSVLASTAWLIARVAAGFVLVVVALVAGLWMLITQPYWPILVGACVVVLAVALAYRVSRYLAVLQAPHKELVWFNSGHGANHTAATEWNEFLIDHVLGVEERAQAPR